MADTPTADQPAVDTLSYEAARDELVSVVQRLESGVDSLEESMVLWERGEALAQHCEAWLSNARQRLEAAKAATKSDSDSDSESESEQA